MVIVSSFMLINNYMRLQNEQEEFNLLTEAKSSYNNETVSAYYNNLKTTNNDFLYWLTVPQTNINYPVMYTPQNPEYYLHRDFTGKYSKSGVPFLDVHCYNNCGNYIIYGHNMKNGTMFAELLNYDKKEYWQQHKKIVLQNSSGSWEYIIIAAFYSQIHEESQPNVFRYYEYTDLTEETVFNEFIENVKSFALYNTDIIPQYGEQLLTLSTCSYHTDKGRFVVVAKEYKTPSQYR